MIGRVRALIPHKISYDRLFHFGGALASRGMEAGGKFGLYMLAAHMMGATSSGLFFLCLTWVNLCSTAARMGLERAMSRHLAAELAIGHGHAARKALVTGVGWITVASAAAAGGTALIAAPLAVHVFRLPELAYPLAVSALILVPQTLAFAIGFALIGLHRPVMGQMVQSALPPVLSLLALVAGLTELTTVLIVYAGSYAVCCLLGLACIAWDWRHAMVDRVVEAPETPIEPLPSLWVTARPFLVIELVQVTLLSVPVLMLGMFADPAAVSAFSIVSRITMLINTMLVSIAMIAAPGFASHHRRREYAALRNLERQTRMVAMVLCLPVILGMVVFVHPLLGLMASDLPGAAAALYVLSIAQVVNVALPTQDMMLSMTGHGALLRRLNLQQLVVCCVLSAILIPLFAMMGAAVVSTICLIQGRVSFALAVRRVLPELSAAK